MEFAGAPRPGPPSLLKGARSSRPPPWTLAAATPSSSGVDPRRLLKLESALSVEALVRQITEWDVQPSDSSDNDSDILLAAESEARRSPLTHKQVKLFDKSMVAGHRRRYIERTIEIDSDDDSLSDEEQLNEPDFIELFRSHVKRKKLRKKIRANPDLQLQSEKVPVPSRKSSKLHKRSDSDYDKSSLLIDEKTFSKSMKSLNKSRRKIEKEEKLLSSDQVGTRRKRLWLAIVRKEVGKAQKSRNYNIKEKLTNSKRIASHCMRAVRQKALLAQRNAKETVTRAKRLTREMQNYWKRFDRVERQQKRQLEKEAEEQQKLDVQLLEAKRQQRKLNFLITQTELYAHFIANKIGAKGFVDSEASILERLDEEPINERMLELDDYDPEDAKMQARNNAAQALESQYEHTKRYNVGVLSELVNDQKPGIDFSEVRTAEFAQPSLFLGTLKNYQLKGMNWLINLYDQGINGILADEMGLGKTVQSIAMLAHIAEHYNIWGPFLVITPASTLHNWQQEVARFLPSFKVVPYWGSPQERKILRHFWDQTNLHTRSASFHIVITSYQLVITDFKYFNRIKWQYLVLDEAQAIKSSSSQRWKMLLEFKCRNRLLLSGTPIQNSMAELWSLLHFVMPTLFDSHEEFNDWFSKDIESSAENKSQIDERQISRLHLILKPFMLRRIKKDVENELTDKLEVLVYCPLTTRQKLLYLGLKRKIRIEELLQGLGSQSQSSALSSSLMNLVMQFRKVCNHPELFERREARSPFVMDIGPYLMPKLIFHHNIHFSTNPVNHLKHIRASIFNQLHVHRSLCPSQSNEVLEVSSSQFSFLRFVDTSPSELQELTISLLAKWLHLAREIKRLRDSLFREKHFKQSAKSRFLDRRGLIIFQPPLTSIDQPDLVFTRTTKDCIYTHTEVTISSMPETMKHRIMRSKHRNKSHKISQNLLPEFKHIPRPKETRFCQPCPVPKFLLATCPRVATPGRLAYCYDRSAAWHLRDHLRCSSDEGFTSVKFGSPELSLDYKSFRTSFTETNPSGGILGSVPPLGWSNIVVPDKETLVFDAGKLFVLDGLLERLKSEGHRVLIYSQMTRMIDLLEEYMIHRKHTFIRLDGSSKIHERRDMVADFQQRSDIFVFLLSTRAGGLGINLTAADTVIFYDSDWNPTVDQQAMDRAHRLGQTKQVTVYRLICKGTIEERILQRAREKSAIQEMVIQGRSFKGKATDLKPKEVVSLLLDDEEIEKRYKEQSNNIPDKEKSRKRPPPTNSNDNSLSVQPSSNQLSPGQLSEAQLSKKLKLVTEESKTSYEEESNSVFDTDDLFSDQESSFTNIDIEGYSDNAVSREPTRPPSPLVDFLGEKLGPKRLHKRTGAKRGRPKGPLKARDSMTNGTSACLKRGPGRPKVPKQNCSEQIE